MQITNINNLYLRDTSTAKNVWYSIDK